MKFFESAHLPERLAAIAQPCGDLARAMDQKLLPSEQKNLGLQRLLEAKDCFVRAML